MSTVMPTPTRALDRLDEQAGDALVEALVFSTPYKDPFDQAAAVAEHLWDRGIVLAHANSMLTHMILMATTFILIGAVIGSALHGVIDGVHVLDPILDLTH